MSRRDTTVALQVLDQLPDRVFDARSEDGLSLSDLGEHLRMSKSTLSQFERGDVDIRLSTVMRILEWLRARRS